MTSPPNESLAIHSTKTQSQQYSSIYIAAILIQLASVHSQSAKYALQVFSVTESLISIPQTTVILCQVPLSHHTYRQ